MDLHGEVGQTARAEDRNKHHSYVVLTCRYSFELEESCLRWVFLKLFTEFFNDIEDPEVYDGHCHDLDQIEKKHKSVSLVHDQPTSLVLSQGAQDHDHHGEQAQLQEGIDPLAGND